MEHGRDNGEWRTRGRRDPATLLLDLGSFLRCRHTTKTGRPDHPPPSGRQARPVRSATGRTDPSLFSAATLYLYLASSLALLSPHLFLSTGDADVSTPLFSSTRLGTRQARTGQDTSWRGYPFNATEIASASIVSPRRPVQAP